MDKCNLIWLMVVLVESSYGQMMSTAQMYNKIAEIEQTVLDLKKQLANYGTSRSIICLTSFYQQFVNYAKS